MKTTYNLFENNLTLSFFFLEIAYKLHISVYHDKCLSIKLFIQSDLKQ